MKNKLSQVQISRSYLKWCAHSDKGKEFQKIWRRTPWTTRDPDEPLKLVSNINPGDRFMHGEDHWKAHTPKISLVYRKIVVVEVNKPARMQYEIGHNIGGFWYKPFHEDFIETEYFIWIPYFEQLIVLGFPIEEAYELITGKTK